MSIVLLLLPLATAISALVLYRHGGKREILKLDFVQFMYAFVISPAMLIWLKSFLFFLLRHELNFSLSVSELFVIDTIFTVLFVYIFAFVVIHSLTKTFSLRITRDPLYDLFEHSEFFHWNLSHLAIYVGVLTIVVLLSMVNLFLPLVLIASKTLLYTVMAVGAVAGIITFTAVWIYEAPDPYFLRLMKLVFGVYFLIHVGVYFIAEPRFHLNFSMYWFSFSFFVTCIMLSVFAERREVKQYWWQQLPFRLNPTKIKYYWRFSQAAVQKLRKG